AIDHLRTLPARRRTPTRRGRLVLLAQPPRAALRRMRGRLLPCAVRAAPWLRRARRRPVRGRARRRGPPGWIGPARSPRRPARRRPRPAPAPGASARPRPPAPSPRPRRPTPAPPSLSQPIQVGTTVTHLD